MIAPIKVLHVITSLERGGAEVSLTRLLESPGYDGIRHVGVATLSGSDTPLSRRIVAAGVPVHHLGGSGPVEAWRRWRRLLASTQPDILHAWLIHPAALLSLLPHRVPLVLGIRHSLDSLAGEKFLTRAIIRALAILGRRARRICYVSHTGRRQHEAIGYPAAKGVVIPNGFPVQGIPAAPAGREALHRQLGAPHDSFVFGQLARCHPIKGQDLLLRAFATVLANRSDARLVLIGAGTDAPSGPISALASELGISGHIHALGARDDVPALLSGLDCLVNPSRSEAMPNAVAEGMLASLPTIATTVGDTHHVLGDAGVAVAPDRPDLMAEAMMDLMARPVEERAAMGRAARDRIAANFSREAMIRGYAELYHDVAGRNVNRALR